MYWCNSNGGRGAECGALRTIGCGLGRGDGCAAELPPLPAAPEAWAPAWPGSGVAAAPAPSPASASTVLAAVSSTWQHKHPVFFRHLLPLPLVKYLERNSQVQDSLCSPCI